MIWGQKIEKKNFFSKNRHFLQKEKRRGERVIFRNTHVSKIKFGIHQNLILEEQFAKIVQKKIYINYYLINNHYINKKKY